MSLQPWAWAVQGCLRPLPGFSPARQPPKVAGTAHKTANLIYLLAQLKCVLGCSHPPLSTPVNCSWKRGALEPTGLWSFPIKANGQAQPAAVLTQASVQLRGCPTVAMATWSHQLCLGAIIIPSMAFPVAWRGKHDGQARLPVCAERSAPHTCTHIHNSEVRLPVCAEPCMLHIHTHNAHSQASLMPYRGRPPSSFLLSCSRIGDLPSHPQVQVLGP